MNWASVTQCKLNLVQCLFIQHSRTEISVKITTHCSYRTTSLPWYNREEHGNNLLSVWK